jgi:hypothetical protein
VEERCAGAGTAVGWARGRQQGWVGRAAGGRRRSGAGRAVWGAAGAPPRPTRPSSALTGGRHRAAGARAAPQWCACGAGCRGGGGGAAPPGGGAVGGSRRGAGGGGSGGAGGVATEHAAGQDHGVYGRRGSGSGRGVKDRFRPGGVLGGTLGSSASGSRPAIGGRRASTRSDETVPAPTAATPPWLPPARALPMAPPPPPRRVAARRRRCRPRWRQAAARGAARRAARRCTPPAASRRCRRPRSPPSQARAQRRRARAAPLQVRRPRPRPRRRWGRGARMQHLPPQKPRPLQGPEHLLLALLAAAPGSAAAGVLAAAGVDLDGARRRLDGVHVLPQRDSDTRDVDFAPALQVAGLSGAGEALWVQARLAGARCRSGAGRRARRRQQHASNAAVPPLLPHGRRHSARPRRRPPAGARARRRCSSPC